MSYIGNNGYIRITDHKHHFADKRGMVCEHRLVWEKHNNAVLLPWGMIHHRNGIKHDNRIENLEAMTKSYHSRYHNARLGDHRARRGRVPSDRECLVCKSKQTRVHRRKGRPSPRAFWYRYKTTDKWLCNNCNRMLFIINKFPTHSTSQISTVIV